MKLIVYGDFRPIRVQIISYMHPIRMWINRLLTGFVKIIFCPDLFLTICGEFRGRRRTIKWATYSGEREFETYSGKCEFAKYSGECEFETLQEIWQREYEKGNVNLKPCRSNCYKNYAQNKLKVECQSLWYLTRRNSGKNIFSHHPTAIKPQVQGELFWRSAWKHVDGLLPKFIRSWSQVPVHFYALG